MRRIALIIGLVGLGFLIGFLLYDGKNVESLDDLMIGEVVFISGIVESERKFGSGKLLIVGEVPVFCECEIDYTGLNVFVNGIIEKFPEDLRLRAFSVEILD